MNDDGRPLHIRVKALANRFNAVADGAAKQPQRSLQDAQNAKDTADMLYSASDALAGAKPAPSFRQSWPFAVVFPDNSAMPGGHNVRQPDGTVVFSLPVSQPVAQQACDALNRRWIDDSSLED